jgi:type III secretory pathway component EscT
MQPVKPSLNTFAIVMFIYIQELRDLFLMFINKTAPKVKIFN